MRKKKRKKERKREREMKGEGERGKEILVIVSMTFGLANLNTIVVDKLFLNKFTALEFGQKKRKKFDDGEKGRGREKRQRDREREKKKFGEKRN